MFLKCGVDMVLTWKIRTPWTFLWYVSTEVFMKCGVDMVLTWKIRTPWTFLWHVLTEVFLKCGVDMENTETLDIFVVFLDRGVPEMWC